MADHLVLPAPAAVVPAAWAAGDRPAAIFNPALLADGPGWLLAVRVVAADGRRRIALCRLGADFRPVAGPPVPWSDHVEFPASVGSERVRTWFADPRLYRWNGRLFVSWNTGWHEPENCQFLQETDPSTLLPVGPPVELRLEAKPRQQLEKNWLFFGDGGERVLYAPSPFQVYAAAPESGAVFGPNLASGGWQDQNFASRYGPLRGGAPPVCVQGDWFVFCHAVSGIPGEYRYAPFVLRFGEHETGYRVKAVPSRQLPLPNPFGSERQTSKLNPAVGEVIYPCGAVYREGMWMISYGINDERAAICHLPHSSVLSCLSDVG